MEKMIKLSSYVDLISNGDEDDRDKLMSITDYTGLITELPTLSMFIPCDDDGDPIVKKVISVKKYEKNQKGLGMTGDALEELVDQYEDALENVLFKEWIYNDGDITSWQTGFNLKEQGWKTIEDMIDANIDLFPNKACIKRHGLPEKVAA